MHSKGRLIKGDATIFEIIRKLSSKEERVARQSIGSTFIVTFGNILYGLVLAITSLIVARLLGPAEYGVYGLALAIPLFLQLLAGVGVQPASTRYSSYYIPQGNMAEHEIEGPRA